MKGAGLAIVLSLVPALAVPVLAAAEPASRPNIVVVIADDHGQWATGVYGNPQVRTPNLDWMAREGVRFANAISPAPVCSPARASFLTGKMPSQHGVHDFISEAGPYDRDWLKGETLISERLQELGYRTGLFGKWHATHDSFAPQRGFDRWLSYDRSVDGWANHYLHTGTVHFSNDGEALSYTGVQASFLTSEAIRFIDEVGDQPFFLNLNFVEPHAPFDGLPERLAALYRDKARAIVPAGGTSDLPARNAKSRLPPDHEEQLAQYLAAVTLIDEQMGRLLDALESRGLLQNTVVVYASDHGMLVGQYGLYGKTNATEPVNFYEETIRIPLIVYGGFEQVHRAQVRNEFVDLIDLHATVLDYASGGGTIDVSYGPGRSFRTLLRGEAGEAWNNLHFAERGSARMVTDGRWKLVRYYQRNLEDPPVDYWYDLSHPEGERYRSPAPRENLRKTLTLALEQFFEQYETGEHTGRRVWDQPYPNAKEERRLSND